ncbi:MAG: gamma-glutamyltransferase family protein, partial [Novosphingobium sp.]|nr:gamma-glutamyltransferase family protein [Novosphingobium sp.]
LDGRETAPAAAGSDWFLEPDGKPMPFGKAMLSGLSIGVPGNLRLAEEAHRRHGRLPWAELFAPAIRLAREGWELTERARMFLELRPQSAARDPAGLALFYDQTGKPLPAGTWLRNPQLADTLETLARKGASALYQGDLAAALQQRIAADTPRQPAMSLGDLAGYQVKERAPLCGHYRLYRICGMGPPSSGATTVLAILGQLERFDLAALGPRSAVAWHLFAESQRLAYADRERFLADPDYIAVPALQLIDPAYLAKRGALIDPNRTMARAEPGLDMPPPDGMEPPEQGTSHFVVVDRWGNAVSYTSTIEAAFGSGLMFGGFYLNNELTDFSFLPEREGRPVANRVEPGKRPRSSMAPTLVFGPDGRLVLAIGAAGGGTIPVQVSRALIGFIDWRLPIDQALALPMLYSPGDVVTVEEGSWLEDLIPSLKELGHAEVRAGRLPIKGNAIVLAGSSLAGSADPRSEGQAISE